MAESVTVTPIELESRILTSDCVEREGGQQVPHWLGTIQERYRLLRLIGEGGAGLVYEAEDRLLRRAVAVKLLRPTVARHAEMVRRFRREALTVAQLDEPRIAAILDFGATPQGVPFMVMELLQGANLQTVLDLQGCLEPRVAVDIVIQACRALQSCHDRGVVHRDVKPSNLFLCATPRGRPHVKLLDFGIAKLLDPEFTSSHTGAGLLGTLRYMPPEQARSPSNVDGRADIYALGAILYRALSGRLLHEGQTEAELLGQLLYSRPARLTDLAPSIDVRLAQVVHRTIDPDPKQRFPSARAFAKALGPFSTAGASIPSSPEAARPLAAQTAAEPARDSRGSRTIERLIAISICIGAISAGFSLVGIRGAGRATATVEVLGRGLVTAAAMRARSAATRELDGNESRSEPLPLPVASPIPSSAAKPPAVGMRLSSGSGNSHAAAPPASRWRRPRINPVSPY